MLPSEASKTTSCRLSASAGVWLEASRSVDSYLFLLRICAMSESLRAASIVGEQVAGWPGSERDRLGPLARRAIVLRRLVAPPRAATTLFPLTNSPCLPTTNPSPITRDPYDGRRHRALRPSGRPYARQSGFTGVVAGCCCCCLASCRFVSPFVSSAPLLSALGGASALDWLSPFFAYRETTLLWARCRTCWLRGGGLRGTSGSLSKADRRGSLHDALFPGYPGALAPVCVPLPVSRLRIKKKSV